MSTSIQWIAAVVVAIAVTAFAAPAAWAGQEEQFTPEYKALRSVADPKHTPKIVAPDAVKRGQWFESPGCTCTRSSPSRRSPSLSPSTRAAC